MCAQFSETTSMHSLSHAESRDEKVLSPSPSLDSQSSPKPSTSEAVDDTDGGKSAKPVNWTKSVKEIEKQAERDRKSKLT